MAQRKKSTETLTGHHSAERTSEIIPIYSDLKASAPDYLHPYAVDVFNTLYPILTKGGSLKETDLQMFVSFCVEAGMVRESSEQLQDGLFLKNSDDEVYVNPAEKQFRLHSQAMAKLGVELGLSPRARQAVTITQTDQIKSNGNLSKLIGDE